MRRALLSLILLVALSSVASADPIIITDPIVITDGTATIVDPVFFGPASFNLLAPGFSASGTGGFSTSGGVTSIHGNTRVFPGSLTYNGTVLTGSFDDRTTLLFSLAPFTAPPSIFNPGPDPGVDTVIVNTAFTMTGTLVLAPPSTGMCCEPPLFMAPVTGSGFAQITYSRFFSSNDFIPTHVAYDFGATEPVPEPMTLTLLGAGLAGIAVKVRRRRRADGGV